MGSSSDPEKGEQRVAEGVPAYYGTFQGQPNYPQPVPPSEAPHYASGDRNYQYQSVQGNQGRVVEGRPFVSDQYHGEGKLPFCNLGFGWFLFILGFFFVIPWYIGAIAYVCIAYDHRERTGLMACAIAALVVVVAGGSKAGGAF